MTRILAIDYGRKRIGLAKSDPDRIIASPAGFIENTNPENIIGHIREVVTAEDVGKVVVGLPLTLAGEKGPAAQDAEEFAALLGKSLEVPVVMWDERLSTAAAERSLLSANVTRKKRKIKRDQIAAQMFLSSYLAATRG